MELRERLQVAVKEAMKAKLPERLSTLRMVSSAIKDREIAARGEGTAVGENDILTLLGKMVKQRQESAKAYAAGGRPELETKEMNEIKVLNEFLPQQVTGADLETAIAAAVAEAEATSVKDMGRVMAVLKAKYTGMMDFGAVGALIKAQLS
ncbi:MAG: glutamyl-tRNA amidotransferase [Rhodobacterales bacterium 17-64-5]|nr:MAG: glutamyl-tRNA amidotransferase [Rhodobacterales bacterium 17-64-5]